VSKAGITDIIVVGAGLAGLVAANRAADLGKSVIVLETSEAEKNQCASRLSGGVFHVGYRSVWAPLDELTANIAAVTGGFVKPALAHALAGNASRAIDWLRGAGAELTKIEPDWGWRDCVLAPLGFHDQPHLVWENLGADVHMQRLATRLQGRAEIRRGEQAQGLVIEDGACRGVIAAGPSGTRRLRAGAVVLADGGFQGNPDMLRRYVTPHPEQVRLRGPAAGKGDGIRMAEAAGAELVGMAHFYGHVLSADALENDALCPFPFVEFMASAGLIVDSAGQRFVDEGKGGIYMANALARHGDGRATVIFDEPIWNDAGKVFFCPPNPNLVNAGGTLYQADDLATLAKMAGLPATALQQTVAAHNAAVAEGRLAAQSPPRRTTKYAAVPVLKPPFYAAPACAAITHTMGGVAVDPKARVLRRGGSPIPGLLAAGSTCGGLEGGPEAGYMGGLIKALVFGLLAAETAAEKAA
jgi:fumarate reductase flavoprotein subunit